MGKGSGGIGRGGGIKHLGSMDAQNLGDLSRYMRDNFGVRMDRSVSRVDFEVAREMSSGIEAMLGEFPGITGADLRITGRMPGGSAYAGTTVNGEILLHPGVLTSPEAVKRAYERDLRTGYHPEGTRTINIVIHEMGHQIEAELLRRRIPGNSAEAKGRRNEAWRNGTVAHEIVSKALDRAAPGWHQNPQMASDHIGQISRYAGTDPSETVAEAISDYYSNRRNAKPLSKEIWRIAKEELG